MNYDKTQNSTKRPFADWFWDLPIPVIALSGMAILASLIGLITLACYLFGPSAIAGIGMFLFVFGLACGITSDLKSSRRRRGL